MMLKYTVRLNNSTVGFFVVAALCIFKSDPALAETWGLVPDEARNTTDPMPFVLIIPQTTIEGGKDPGAAAPFQLSTSLLGALVTSAMNAVDSSARHHKAVEAVAPLVPALAGFDANAVLRNAFDKSLNALAWTRLTNIPSASGDNKSLPPEIAAAPRIVLATCAYMLPGDLDSVFAFCEVAAFRKNSATDSTAVSTTNPGIQFFNRRIEVQVGLVQHGADNNARREQWVAGDGAALKHALTVALSNVADLSAKALAQTQSDYTNYRSNRTGSYLDTHGGKIVGGGENIINSHESCFNRKNKSSIKVDSTGTLLQEEDGSLYACMGLSAN